MVRKLDVPWITKDGYFDFTKFPMDSVLKQALSGENSDLMGACSVLDSMYHAGRPEAAVYLYGLMVHNYNNIQRKEIIVKHIGVVKTKECANILFKELNDIESNNTTRGYVNSILNILMTFPLPLIRDGFEALMNNNKWSVRMKRKFEDIILEKGYFTV